jgi:GNAT superfamily N-acetyltransferase
LVAVSAPQQRPGTDGPIGERAHAPAALEVPSAHLGLTWRPLADVEDLDALVTAIEEADHVPRRTSAAELEQWLASPWIDLTENSLAGYDHTGSLRSYGIVEIRPGDETRVRAFLHGGVHPEWRGGGLGRALVAWMEGRGRQMLAATGRSGPARLAAYIDESARDYRRLYAAAGFSPIRWYADMRRDLAAPVPEPADVDGVRVVGWTDDLDDAVRRAHNLAFRDHWGSEPHSPESWHSWLRGPYLEPRWSMVALDDTDAVAGYLVSERHGAEVQGFESGFTAVLGVVPAWRRKGLASALLVRAMAMYRDAGMPYATLDVDADNPMGAHALYARLGYQRTHGWVLYSVEI